MLNSGVIHLYLNLAGVPLLRFYILDTNIVPSHFFLTLLCIFQSNIHSFWCALNSLRHRFILDHSPVPYLCCFFQAGRWVPGRHYVFVIFPQALRGSLLLMLLCFPTKLKESRCLTGPLMSLVPSLGDRLEHICKITWLIVLFGWLPTVPQEDKNLAFSKTSRKGDSLIKLKIAPSYKAPYPLLSVSYMLTSEWSDLLCNFQVLFIC